MAWMKSLYYNYCIDLQVLQKETDANKNEQKNGNEILEKESTQTSYIQTWNNLSIHTNDLNKST